jgi:prevent-host-death family protein
MRMSVREFKAHLSRYLAEARAGRSVEISSHRKVVACLVTGSSGQEQAIERLLAQGLAQWDGSKPSGASIRLSSGGRLVSDLVQEDRG